MKNQEKTVFYIERNKEIIKIKKFQYFTLKSKENHVFWIEKSRNQAFLLKNQDNLVFYIEKSRKSIVFHWKIKKFKYFTLKNQENLVFFIENSRNQAFPIENQENHVFYIEKSRKSGIYNWNINKIMYLSNENEEIKVFSFEK